MNEDDSDAQYVSNYQYYFEVILSVIMLLNSFFSYSYLNIIHIIYCVILLRSRYCIEYNFWAKSKKSLIILLVVINLLYLIAKTILYVVYACKVEHELLPKIYPYFIISNDWRSYYDYGVVSFMIFLILIYLIVAEFDEEFWKESILPKTYDLLRKYNSDSSEGKNILNFGVFYISFGGAMYPTLINFVISILCFIFFISIIFTKKCRTVIKKGIIKLFMYIVPFYTIANYILNSNEIKKRISGSITQKYFIELFGNVHQNKENDFFIANAIPATCVPFLLFMKGFNEINVYLNCLHFSSSKKGVEIEMQYINKNKFRNFSEDSSFNDNLNIRDEKEKILSLNDDSLNKAQKKQLQTIFNANLDCGFLIFAKESRNIGLFTTIKMFILKYCYTPAFCLHLCRLSIILWINYYRAYASIIFIFWLLLSMHFSKKICFYIFTKYIVFPILMIIFFASYIANIKGTSYDSIYLGLEYYKPAKLRVLHMINKFLIVTVFQTYLHVREKHTKLLNDLDILKEIKKQQKELELTIKNDLKGKYVIKPLEVFFKAYFFILDILVVVSFYLAVTQTINIVNQLGLLFLISMFILNNRYFKVYGIYVSLIILNLVFIAKYVLSFMYQKEKNIDNITLTEFILNMIVHDNLYNIHYYWFVYYFLFLEYASLSSHLFQICNNKTFSMHELIEQNLETHNYIKIVITTLTNFIFGIYIWLLIPCFVACLIMKDNNSIFSIQLLILFFIYYKYIQIANNNYSKLEQVTNIFKYTWCLIFSTFINCILYTIFK